MRPSCLLLCLLLGAGCRTTTPHFRPAADSFPAEARITQRAVLTVLGREFTLNGYLATSHANGQRLVLTENFGKVLADVLLKPDGTTHVMRSSAAFKPEWIRRYVAADVRCLYDPAAAGDCPGRVLGENHFLIQRRWYQLDLRILTIEPGPQSPDLFQPPETTKP